MIPDDSSSAGQSPSSARRRLGWLEPEPRWTVLLFMIIPVLLIGQAVRGILTGDPHSEIVGVGSLGLGMLCIVAGTFAKALRRVGVGVLVAGLVASLLI